MAHIYPPCPNSECEKFGKQNAGNVVRRGHYGQGRQRYKCNACKRTFSETQDSVTYRLRKPPSLVQTTIRLRQKRFSLRKIARRVHLSLNTVAAGWL